MNSPEPGWPLAVGIAVLLGITVIASWRGRLGIERDAVIATIRAVVQLAAVAAVIGLVLPSWWASLLFAVFMFVVAVRTAASRIETPGRWFWVAVVMLPPVAVVLAVVFATGASPFTGAAIVSIAGIVIGNTMTAVGLAGRRLFDALDEEMGQVEAALALGLTRPASIRLVIERRSSLALVPTLDATRTVGLVKLPGAFIGVLLGGGSAVQAGASQLLVLLGILAGQALVVMLFTAMVANARVLPPPIVKRLPLG